MLNKEIQQRLPNNSAPNISISKNPEKSTSKTKFSLKDDGAGIEDWMRNGMGVDSKTFANLAEADTDGQTEVATNLIGEIIGKEKFLGRFDGFET